MTVFCAIRYAFSKAGGHRARVVRIMITLALSLSVFSSVLSIMNFLQDSRFDDIRDIRSFDAIINGDCRDDVAELLPDSEVFIYAESEAIIDSGAYLVRYIDSDYDGGLRYLIGDSSSLSIPYSLYRRDKRTSYPVTLLKKGRSGARLPKSIDYTVSGIYSTALGSEFDSTMIFLPLSEYDGNSMLTAVKGADDRALRILSDNGYTFRSWKENEASLYSAFAIEKIMMYLVLSLLFIIIAVSERNSVRIFFQSKEKERAELCVIGMSRMRISIIFILSFMLVVLISILFALVISYILLPILEQAISPFIYGEIELKMPLAGFSVFSSFSVAITLLFSLKEILSDKKKDLMEVIHG